MFGSKKAAADTPAAPKQQKNTTPFSAKDFFLNHVEKLALVLFLAGAGYLIYDGITTKRYPPERNPADLVTKASMAKKEIVEGNHWDAIKAERVVTTDFTGMAKDSRSKVESSKYVISDLNGAIVKNGGKRGDPALLAPKDVQVKTFFGAIAVNSSKTAPADSLEDAPEPVPEDKRRPGRKDSTAAKATPGKVRTLNANFDRGYQKGMAAMESSVPVYGSEAGPNTVAPPPIKQGKPYPILAQMNIVTAVIPHDELNENYKTELEFAPGFLPDRDSPNYLGFEVQRVDVTGDPNRQIAENEWQDSKECSTAAQMKWKDTWVGASEEIVDTKYLVEKILTIPIPPILISDYRDLVAHPLVERVKKEMSSMQSYESGASSMMSSMMSSSSSSSSSMMSGSSSPSSSYGGMMAPSTAMDDPALMPKALPPSEYKLIRFYDRTVKAGKTYRYRVRAVLEDPNYPRLESQSPKTSTMKPDVVNRVQELIASEKVANAKVVGTKKLPRASKRTTPWSEPSDPIEVTHPIELYASQVNGTFEAKRIKDSSNPNSKSETLIETIPLKATMVYGEWSPEYAVLVPRKQSVDRGMVLSGPAPEGGLDVIHPYLKTIKRLPAYRFNNPVTVADIRGGGKLAASTLRKDVLMSEGEIVAFDPTSENLVISREFSSLTPFRMYSFADETEPAAPAAPVMVE